MHKDDDGPACGSALNEITGREEFRFVAHNSRKARTQRKVLGLLENLVTRDLGLSIVAVTVGALAVGALVIDGQLATIDLLAKGVDILLKVVGSVVAAAWALNRYFILRTDDLQLRVDAAVDIGKAGSFEATPGLGLLLVRLDIVNTGKALVPPFHQCLVVDEIYPDYRGLAEKRLSRWPEIGLHPGGSIEPGSWSAINFTLPIAESARVVRILLEIYIDNQLEWTWHRNFPVECSSRHPA